ncbi:MAG: class III signal peptide-containing protein [Methanobacterium sp.]|nr:class III signal peptide-containing protein [Methanobacterium sp.]
MNILVDESGQGVAEYLLLFAGVIIIAIGTLVIYNSYFTTHAFDTAADVKTTRQHTGANNGSL